MFSGLLGVLAFLATVLGVLIGLGLLAAALLTRRPRRAGKIAGFLLGWLGLYVLALLLASFTSRPGFVDPGGERCFDEMCYALTKLELSPSLDTPAGQLKAQGQYYIVTIQLRSAAKRTAQKPSQPSVFVVDARGQRYTRMLNAGPEMGLPAGQPLTAAQLWDRQIQPGETVSRTVAFDLPVGVSAPGLVITEGLGPLAVIIIGDENSFFHAPTEFLLNP
jgi:hypothetical protein